MNNQCTASVIVERLFGSFKLLESAIINAKENLTSRPNVKKDVLIRLDSYTELLSKQKTLANELQLLIEQGSWAEVAQKISVINGLLEMIREDAKDVLNALKGIEEMEDATDKNDIILM